MAAVMDPATKMGEQRETGWVSRLFSKEASTPEYQELKFTLHRKLLDRINLEALSSMSTVSDKLGGPPRLNAAGPGLEDMTRLARGSYEIWRDILATNSDHIERALSLYIQKLEHMRENLRTRQLQEEFERGAALAAQPRTP